MGIVLGNPPSLSHWEDKTFRAKNDGDVEGVTVGVLNVILV